MSTPASAAPTRAAAESAPSAVGVPPTSMPRVTVSAPPRALDDAAAAAEAGRKGAMALSSPRGPADAAALQTAALRRSLAQYREETRHLSRALAVSHAPALEALRAEKDDLAAALKVAKLEISVAERHVDVERGKFAEMDAQFKAKVGELVERMKRALQVQKGEIERVLRKERGEKDKVLKEEQAKRVALETRVDELKMEVKRMRESIGAEVEKREMDAKNGKNVLEKRDKELKEVKREKEELMKELKDFRIQMQRNVLDAKAEAKLAIKVNDELLVKLKKETREAREEAAKAVEERNEELRRRTRENANRKSVTRRGTTLDAALVKRQQTHIQDLEAQLAKLEESKLAESQKRESLQAKADDLQTQVVRLQEVHSADYTLPPISLHRSTMSTLLSPAPLAGDSPAPPGRRSKTGTPSMRAADVTPSMERGAGDTTSESRSRFTDSLPFRLEDDDDDEVEDALQDSPLCESEEQDDEQDAPVSAPKRRRKSKAATAKSSMPTKRGRRKTTTAPKPRSTVRRKRHTIEVEEYAESGTETGDISPKNVAQHVDDDSTHPSQKRIVRKGRPKAKRQKVAPEPTPEPQTQSASPATVVQRRAGGRALRSRRPVSYDYDKNDRDIVGKMPGYVVDHGALRPKRVSNPRHSIAKSLDFDLAADTSGAILAANIIRQSAQKRRAKQVQKKSGRRERGG